MQIGLNTLGLTGSSNPFSPTSLFLNGEQGGWYDPSDLSTMYQDAAGTTPAAVEQPVGFIGDKRLGFVRGAELASPTTSTAGWSAVSGLPVLSSDGTSISIQNGATAESYAAIAGFITTAGQYYEITLNVLAVLSGGSVTVGTTRTGLGGPGQKRLILRAAGASTIQFGTNSNAIGDTLTIKDVSVRELPGNHLTQATTATRPTLSARVNSLITTGGLLAAGPNWSNGLNLTGVLQADGSTLLTRNDTVNSAYASQSTAVNTAIAYPVGTPLVCRLKVKPGTVGNFYGVRLQSTYPQRADAVLNFATGQIVVAEGNTYTNVSASVAPPDSDGFYTIILRGTIGGSTLTQVIHGPSTSGTTSWEGVNASLSNAYAKEPDLRTAADAALNIPAYQRVNTATDYDTDGFPLYLMFDGVDDKLLSAPFAGSGGHHTLMAAIKHQGGGTPFGTVMEWGLGSPSHLVSASRSSGGSKLLSRVDTDAMFNQSLVSADDAFDGSGHVVRYTVDANRRVAVDLAVEMEGALSGSANFADSAVLEIGSGPVNQAQFSNIAFYGGIYLRSAATPADFARVTRFLASKMGLYF